MDWSRPVLSTQYLINDIEKYKNKAFSCLQLIPEESFKRGIYEMENDIKRNGYIRSISRNYAIWCKKGG